MKEHQFTIILEVEPNEKDADRIYGILDDGTLSTSDGVPQIRFHREASSLEEAIRTAVVDVISAGFYTARVEIEPDVIVPHANIYAEAVR